MTLTPSKAYLNEQRNLSNQKHVHISDEKPQNPQLFIPKDSQLDLQREQIQMDNTNHSSACSDCNNRFDSVHNIPKIMSCCKVVFCIHCLTSRAIGNSNTVKCQACGFIHKNFDPSGLEDDRHTLKVIELVKSSRKRSNIQNIQQVPRAMDPVQNHQRVMGSFQPGQQQYSLSDQYQTPPELKVDAYLSTASKNPERPENPINIKMRKFDEDQVKKLNPNQEYLQQQMALSSKTKPQISKLNNQLPNFDDLRLENQKCMCMAAENDYPNRLEENQLYKNAVKVSQSQMKPSLELGSFEIFQQSLQTKNKANLTKSKLKMTYPIKNEPQNEYAAEQMKQFQSTTKTLQFKRIERVYTDQMKCNRMGCSNSKYFITDRNLYNDYCGHLCNYQMTGNYNF